MLFGSGHRYDECLCWNINGKINFSCSEYFSAIKSCLYRTIISFKRQRMDRREIKWKRAILALAIRHIRKKTALHYSWIIIKASLAFLGTAYLIATIFHTLHNFIIIVYVRSNKNYCSCANIKCFISLKILKSSLSTSVLDVFKARAQVKKKTHQVERFRKLFSRMQKEESQWCRIIKNSVISTINFTRVVCSI